MVYTKRKVETEQDRFGGYANYVDTASQNQNFYGNRYSQDNDTTLTETYNPYATAGSVQTETEDVETPTYEYEQEYYEPQVEEENFNETVNPFKVKSFEVQNIERKMVTKTNYKINARGKIMLTVYSAICAILIAFAIYNVVFISGLASANAAQASVLESKQQVITMLEDEYNYLGSDEGVSAKLASDTYFSDYVSASEENVVTMYLGEVEEMPTYEVPTNWFDKVCEFFSELLN